MSSGYPSKSIEERGEALLDTLYDLDADVPRISSENTLGQLLIDAYREGFAEACQVEDGDELQDNPHCCPQCGKSKRNNSVAHCEYTNCPLAGNGEKQ